MHKPVPVPPASVRFIHSQSARPGAPVVVMGLRAAGRARGRAGAASAAARANVSARALPRKRSNERRCLSRRALAEESAATNRVEGAKGEAESKEQPVLAKSLQRGEPCSFDREVIEREFPVSHQLPQWTRDEAAYLKQTLCARVYDVAEETDLQKAETLSAKLKNTVFLKREDKQQVFSFKLRGAFNK